MSPNLDGTGPEGKGPKTGMQRGNCNEATPISGRGQGLGPCGKGLKRCRGFRRNW